jgi:YegS/Rv2252/BmrU family lipid kinase
MSIHNRRGRRVVLVYNPEAGPQPLPLPVSGRAAGGAAANNPEWLAAVSDYLRERSPQAEILPAPTFAAARAAAHEAAASGAALVIGAGGDGTLRAVADGLAHGDTPLGILPRGTVNVLARELRIPLGDPLAACDIALSGETRRIDLGCIADPAGNAPAAPFRHFLLMASVGFDAATVGKVHAPIKGLVGAPAYVLSGVATLATFTPFEVTLVLDGVERLSRAFMVVASNVPAYGGDFRIAPDASLDDGLLDVCVFEAPPGPVHLQRASFVRQMGALALGRHLLDPDVACFRARRISITAEPPTATQIDGDALGATPITVGVAPRALSVRVPPPPLLLSGGGR